MAFIIYTHALTAIHFVKIRENSTTKDTGSLSGTGIFAETITF